MVTGILARRGYTSGMVDGLEAAEEARKAKARDRARAWRAKNKDRCKQHEENRKKDPVKWSNRKVKSRDTARKWAAANPERVAHNQKKWARENPDKAQEKVRRWEAKHPEAAAALAKRRKRNFPGPEMDKFRADRKAYRDTNPDKTHASKIRRYGITGQQYVEMLEAQGGGCAICKATESNRSSRRLSVDHDHLTGKVRGLLCSRCNHGLGLFRDDPGVLQVARDYLLTNLMS